VIVVLTLVARLPGAPGRRAELRDAEMVLAQLGGRFEDYNTISNQCSCGYR
jgi:hypothetical protein